MVYYKVPVVNGVLDIDYFFLQEGLQTAMDECYVRLKDGAEARPSWQAITEAEFNEVKENLLNPPA